MLNYFVWNRAFSCVEAIDWCLIELLVLNSSAWKDSTMSKQMIDFK